VLSLGKLPKICAAGILRSKVHSLPQKFVN
jgi:hypothetical protein